MSELNRDDFEAWIATDAWLCDLSVERSGDQYVDLEVNAAWLAWQAHRKTRIENAENCTDAAPCAQKTAEFSDDEIIAAANGWREYDAPDGLSPIERMVYGACRAAIAADRKLRGDA